MKTNSRHCSPQHKPDWQQERAGRLHRQFLRVDAARKGGKSVKAALLQFCWYWRGKHYRTNSRIMVRLSMPTLRRLYYTWIADGRKPEALKLNFNPARIKIPAGAVDRFIGHASAPGILTFAAAFRSMQQGKRALQCSQNHFVGTLPAGLRRALRRLFYCRRKQRGIEVWFRRSVQKGGFAQ